MSSCARCLVVATGRLFSTHNARTVNDEGQMKSPPFRGAMFAMIGAWFVAICAFFMHRAVRARHHNTPFVLALLVINIIVLAGFAFTLHEVGKGIERRDAIVKSCIDRSRS